MSHQDCVSLARMRAAARLMGVRSALWSRDEKSLSCSCLPVMAEQTNAALPKATVWSWSEVSMTVHDALITLQYLAAIWHVVS